MPHQPSPEQRIELWKNALHRLSRQEYDLSYEYPATDDVVDRSVLTQDPKKRATETNLIRNFCRGDWTIAMDLGCGLGANFGCIDAAVTTDKYRLLIGIDADPRRAKAAEEAALNLRQIKTSVHTASINDVATVSSGLKIDLGICIQVLGHLKSRELQSAASGLRSLMASGARILVAIPFVTSELQDNVTSQQWDGNSDYFHVVDLTKHPSDKGFRSTVNAAEFDKLSFRPNLLPVRSFLTHVEASQNLSEILRAEPPPHLVRLLEGFSPVSTHVYSVHLWDATLSRPLIGDVMVELIRD